MPSNAEPFAGTFSIDFIYLDAMERVRFGEFSGQKIYFKR